ncbi:non-hydrolyzing UDP-N-acetylglucosamine 2-epimerase [Candidatus Omnitrophota bacterium]
MTKKILFVFGTRPEVIKMAPVIELARQSKTNLDPVICVTAQHRYLLDQALAEFNIDPDIDLDLMRPNQSLYDVVSQVLHGVRDVYRKIRPEIVLVQGDTSTVFAASLACYYEGIDVGHIEAGLRSRDNQNPFPEEINRRFVSLIAKYNFCPTKSARENLLQEAIQAKKIFVTGNTIIDTLDKSLEEIGSRQLFVHGVDQEFLQKPFALITGHRRENFDGGMKNICVAIKYLAKNHNSFNWLWSMHLNPNAREVIFKTLNGLENIKLIEPPPYREFVYLMKSSKFIISDSGGVQEEAPSLGKKVLVTRICTERPEALKSGNSILVGTDPDKITKEAYKLLNDKRHEERIKNPFGDGMAARRIIDVITKGSCEEFK